MIRILVYYLVSNKVVEKDANAIVIRNAIDVLNRYYDNLSWKLIVPYASDYFELPNVEQCQYDYGGLLLRSNFEARKLLNIIDWRNNDYDIVYSHFPEHNIALSSLFSSKTNIEPRFISYCHWLETKDNTGRGHTHKWQTLDGILATEECGVNTEWAKNYFLEQAAERYNEATIEQMSKIIQPHYLGIDNVDFSPSRIIPGSILFNHRESGITGYPWFLDAMDTIHKERQDFRVYTTLATASRPYVTKVDLPDRKDYLDFIKSMSLVVGCFQEYSAWSISITDALSRGVPAVLPNDYAYPEMLGSDYPLYYRDKQHFIKIINKLLDSHQLREQLVKKIKPLIEQMTWDARVLKWFDGWKILDPNGFRQIGKSSIYPKIIEMIHKYGFITKNQLIQNLGWGVKIKMNPYRNKLRLEPDISILENGYQSKVTKSAAQAFFGDSNGSNIRKK